MQAIGRSRGGLTTKIMAMVDRTGRLVRFTLKPGNAAESPELATLLDGVQTSELVADKAYDANPIRSLLAANGIIATIPSKENRRRPIWHDPASYRTRHLVENYFADLKQFRGIATRYCKLAESFVAFIKLAGWFLETRGTGRTKKAPQYKSNVGIGGFDRQMQLTQTVGRA